MSYRALDAAIDKLGQEWAEFRNDHATAGAEIGGEAKACETQRMSEVPEIAITPSLLLALVRGLVYLLACVAAISAYGVELDPKPDFYALAYAWFLFSIVAARKVLRDDV